MGTFETKLNTTNKNLGNANELVSVVRMNYKSPSMMVSAVKKSEMGMTTISNSVKNAMSFIDQLTKRIVRNEQKQTELERNMLIQTCNGMGYRDPYSPILLYSSDECAALNGLYHANGECTKKAGGSYSYDCGTLYEKGLIKGREGDSEEIVGNSEASLPKIPAKVVSKPYFNDGYGEGKIYAAKPTPKAYTPVKTPPVTVKEIISNSAANVSTMKAMDMASNVQLPKGIGGPDPLTGMIPGQAWLTGEKAKASDEAYTSAANLSTMKAMDMASNVQLPKGIGGPDPLTGMIPGQAWLTGEKAKASDETVERKETIKTANAPASSFSFLGLGGRSRVSRRKRGKRVISKRRK